MYKINFCSELEWYNDKYIFHHSNEIDSEGNIWVSSRQNPYSNTVKKIMKLRPINTAKKGKQYADDTIIKISEKGKELFVKSVTEILIENNLYSLVDYEHDDPIHLNDVQPVNVDGKFWKKGNVFLSLRNKSMIIHYDTLSNKVLRIIKGPFQLQHDVDILSDKKLIIFNNNSLIDQNISEIILYDYEKNTFEKILNDELKKNNFFTATEGLQDQLDDGSLLIEEQNHGRILFFDRKGSLEWSYVNKAQNGNVYITNWSRLIKDENLLKSIKNKIKNTKCIK